MKQQEEKNKTIIEKEECKQEQGEAKLNPTFPPLSDESVCFLSMARDLENSPIETIPTIVKLYNINTGSCEEAVLMKHLLIEINPTYKAEDFSKIGSKSFIRPFYGIIHKKNILIPYKLSDNAIIIIPDACIDKIAPFVNDNKMHSPFILTNENELFFVTSCIEDGVALDSFNIQKNCLGFKPYLVYKSYVDAAHFE